MSQSMKHLCLFVTQEYTIILIKKFVVLFRLKLIINEIEKISSFNAENDTRIVSKSIIRTKIGSCWEI